MHTVCVYGWPAMLLRLIEYQDWRKIGMADMLPYTILKIVRSDTSEYAISFLRKEVLSTTSKSKTNLNGVLASTPPFIAI